MKKIAFCIIGFCVCILWSMDIHAQTRTVSGTVLAGSNEEPLPGVSVIVQGTGNGTVTDAQGAFQLSIPEEGATLRFSYVGYANKNVRVRNRSELSVTLVQSTRELSEVVVTAYGISREEKSLGYSVQELEGQEMNRVETNNMVSSLSGKIAGVNINTTGNMGGSANMVIRGYSSLTGNNQPLFVVDGVPISNANVNDRQPGDVLGQKDGRSGYDYGNAAMDIDPNNIKSVNVLKGAAATALYGSRAANGVVMITTKKGQEGEEMDINFNSNFTLGTVNENTFPEYQQQYGAGYITDDYIPGVTSDFIHADVDGDGTDDNVVKLPDDASMGPAFDEDLSVYHYDAFIPESDNYQQQRPWVPAENGALTFFENSMNYTNNISVSGGNENSTFRLAYTNRDYKGIMPNSSLKKNNIDLSASQNITDGLKLSGSATYINTQGKGRNSTGYGGNLMAMFRQWWQTNVDIQRQKELYNTTGRNVTWNPVSPTNLTPLYWDNPYWQRHENYQTDERNRLIGYAQLDWQITDNLNFMGRASIDRYNELQEERKAKGSVAGEFGVDRLEVTSGYARFDRSFTETNYDAILRYDQRFSEFFDLSALIGSNIRRTEVDEVYSSTNGGLSVPGIFALSNSTNPMLPPVSRLKQIGVNGYFARASLGFYDTYYLDATLRRDKSSTLPEENNTYYYPSISGSFLFSNLLEANWLSLGKLRINYAEVGSSAPFGSVIDTYDQNASFAGNPVTSVSNTKNNPNLKPERTKSLEAGLNMSMLETRLGLEASVYKRNTIDQITPVRVSFSTGYSSKFFNAGEIENKGLELIVRGAPVVNNELRWDITVNWAKNISEVINLAQGLDNLSLTELQGGISINAEPGEPYGTIQGSDYVYDDQGGRIINSIGIYETTPTSDQTIGDINPDFTAGISNSISYQDFALSFLIDWQQGGDIFSLDQYYGLATGLYPETVFINDQGNPVRSPAAEGGGYILEGVKEDGSQNDTRIEGNFFGFGYQARPNAAFVYDATYVKLREVALTYELPLDLDFIGNASVSLVGANLWILSKNLPYADPEATQSSGKIQGWQSGTLPSTREYGITLNVDF